MSNYETFDEQKQFACRVIADHARSTAFAIADGILPGNEGRNYVLRKIMRRAIYHGREHLGFDKLFFHKVCGFVVDQMKDAYPELAVQKDFIDKMVRLEEERFGNTMTVGLSKLRELIKDGMTEIKFLANLYDTFGTPFDLIFVTCAENQTEITDNHAESLKLGSGVTAKSSFKVSLGTPHYINFVTGEPMPAEEYIDEENFKARFDRAIKRRQQSSEIGKTERKSQLKPIYSDVFNRVGPTQFIGYNATFVEGAKVTSIIRGDVELINLTEGEEAGVVLNTTPFYAEAGGQVGDTGVLTTDQATVLRVIDTFAPLPGLIIHKVKVEKGAIRIYSDDLTSRTPENSVEYSPPDTQLVTATIDVDKRDATRRNHTATHLAHSALREVLGTHVKQAGSVVSPNYLRFDFTHYQPLSATEIKEIEDLVNYQILQNSKVNTDLMSIDEAMRTGAMALFGEKYGEKVRVLSVGNGEFSRELCGGTHVRATGDIGSFKITADEAIASGVRRIRAITGFDAFERFRDDEILIANSLNVLNTQRDNLPKAIEKLQEELKKTRKEIDELKLKIATGAMSSNSASDEPRDVLGVKVVGKIVEDLDANGVRQLSDTLLARLKSGVVILGRSEEGKVGVIVRVSNDLTDKIKAGNIIREIAPIIGGKGGGRPDMAEGGGNLPEKLEEAIEASFGVIEKMLG